MGEVQTRRYICKICNKSCVSGKSLGGHMRVHLALISASKKAAKATVESKMELEGDDCQNGSPQIKGFTESQSNSKLSSEDKINNCNTIPDPEDSDQNNSYELRENPRKSWRVSENGVPCKECGKEFQSLRALSGHMRCHSTKINKKVHQCKICGKGFDSQRAMFGHMKTHSKKLKGPDESAEILSELEKLCPVRRKRSRIRYKIPSNNSFSSLNTSISAVSELGEVEEAARCLMMLSKGVRNWPGFISVMDYSSDDNSLYFGATSSCKRKKVAGNDGYPSGGEGILMSISVGKLDYRIFGSASALLSKKVSDFDDLDSKFAVEKEVKVGFEVSDERHFRVDNKLKFDLKVKDVTLPRVEKAKELNVADDSVKSDSEQISQLDEDAPVGADSFPKLEPNSCLEANVPVSDDEFLKDFGKERKYKGRIRDMIFCSPHKLGVCNAKHKMRGISSSVNMKNTRLSVTEGPAKLYHHECSDEQLGPETEGAGLNSSRRKEHQCHICFRIFPSGQALGGHKRAHFVGTMDGKTNETEAVKQETAADIHDLFDLNIPVTTDEDTGRSIGLNLWLAESGHEHQAPMLTN